MWESKNPASESAIPSPFVVRRCLKDDDAGPSFVSCQCRNERRVPRSDDDD
jgi:hypothetical protein